MEREKLKNAVGDMFVVYGLMEKAIKSGEEAAKDYKELIESGFGHDNFEKALKSVDTAFVAYNAYNEAKKRAETSARDAGVIA